MDAMSQIHRHHRRAKLARFGHHFARRVANQPGAMAIRVEPIDFETSAIFLSAPTATAFEMK
jgi:hypothetical protein